MKHISKYTLPPSAIPPPKFGANPLIHESVWIWNCHWQTDWHDWLTWLTDMTDWHGQVIDTRYATASKNWIPFWVLTRNISCKQRLVWKGGETIYKQQTYCLAEAWMAVLIRDQSLMASSQLFPADQAGTETLQRTHYKWFTADKPYPLFIGLW